MIVQSATALFSAVTMAGSALSRQQQSTAPANTAEKVSISQAALDLYAAHTAQTKTAPSSGSGSKAEFDTDKGTVEIDIESYFTPPTGKGVDIDSVPLLMPSQKNIDALSGYISGHMADFLAQNGIPTPPASITYDNQGEIQLPADYPYAAQFKQALQDNPVMDRALRTTNALTSHLVEMNKSLPFQEEYRAARSQAEIEAVIAKYQYLFSNNRHYDTIALNFTKDGGLSITHDGKPLSEV